MSEVENNQDSLLLMDFRPGGGGVIHENGKSSLSYEKGDKRLL